MTNDRTRVIARNVLSLALGRSRPLDMMPQAETVILAYRDEVRREALKEVRDKSTLGDRFDARSPYQSDATRNGIGLQRRLVVDMLDEMIAATGPVSVSPGDVSVSTSGGAVVVGCDPPSRDADRDFVLRTLAQAYVGNDYTIEGRKFRDAVERLWWR